MSDVNYQMLVEIGGIMDGTVPREGICTTADGVRWLCDRVQELKNELYETKRERDEANTKLQDVSSKLADALRERDEAQESLKHITEYGTEETK